MTDLYEIIFPTNRKGTLLSYNTCLNVLIDTEKIFILCTIIKFIRSSHIWPPFVWTFAPKLSYTVNSCLRFLQDRTIFDERQNSSGIAYSEGCPTVDDITQGVIRLIFQRMHSAENGSYRAMHYSAKRGLAIASRLSVRPSVCL